MDTFSSDETNGHAAPLRVLGVAGSLRSGSYNRALLAAAARDLAPEAGLHVELFEGLAAIPLYDAGRDPDGGADATLPEAVRRFKKAITGADGLLVATPEYNHGVPGALKNAIDWASRPAFESPLKEMPVAIMGASPSGGGTRHAQAALRRVLESTLAEALPAGGAGRKGPRKVFWRRKPHRRGHARSTGRLPRRLRRLHPAARRHPATRRGGSVSRCRHRLTTPSAASGFACVLASSPSSHAMTSRRLRPRAGRAPGRHGRQLDGHQSWPAGADGHPAQHRRHSVAFGAGAPALRHFAHRGHRDARLAGHVARAFRNQLTTSSS